jgi:hemerythrin-like domain-containing protein
LKAVAVSNQRVPIARRRASLPREKDALSVLVQAHRRMAALFARAQQDRRAVVELQHALRVHGRIEEELLFPVLERALGDEVAALLDEARREHSWMKVRLIELSLMEAGGGEFIFIQGRLRELEDHLRKHMKEEERQLFRRARRALSRRRLIALGERMRAREDELNGGLYPG